MLEIKVYGSGCSVCKKLTKLVEDIVKKNEIEAEVKYVNDFKEAAQLNILAMPAISINGVLKSSGRVPARKEIEEWLSEK